MASARVITPAHEVPGELLVGESSLYFVAEDKHLCSVSYLFHQKIGSNFFVDSGCWQYHLAV